MRPEAASTSATWTRSTMALDRGPSDFDVKHRLTAGIVWEMPFFHTASGIEKSAAWRLGGKHHVQRSDGQPLHRLRLRLRLHCLPARCLQRARPKKNCKTLQDISSIYGPNSYSYQNLPGYGGYGYNEWTNPLTGTSDMPLAGAPAPVGWLCHEHGLPQRLLGPGTWGEDFKLSKAFHFRERYAANLSGTSINVFNHANTYPQPRGRERRQLSPEYTGL